MKSCYITHTHPQALAENCIIGPHYRITLLTDKLVRFEYNVQNKFEDRPTQIVMNRDFPAVSYTVEHTADGLVVRTDRLRIVYDEKPFSPNGLSVALVGYENAHTGNWYYGDAVHDLKGTARTLDTVDGDNVELGHGLISTEGYAVLDDSTSLVLQDDGWVEPRSGGEDFYFFGYGRDYLEAIQDFYRLSGHAPMLPRYALGNWWSRFYPYTEETYLSLMERFHNENLPFSVAVIDMDWHIVDIDPKYGNGWTGFTWNKKLFPNPERFLSELHRRGMRVTLNVHPADGIRAYEDAYTKIAEDMGVDLESGHAVEFDPADPKFLQNYYADVLRPLEDKGVDFWWVDWQQGTHTRITGLDPLWMLNHYGFLDNGQGNKRPMAFSRYGGPGSHRYPVGFSGDTIVRCYGRPRNGRGRFPASGDILPRSAGWRTGSGYGRRSQRACSWGWARRPAARFGGKSGPYSDPAWARRTKATRCRDAPDDDAAPPKRPAPPSCPDTSPPPGWKCALPPKDRGR